MKKGILCLLFLSCVFVNTTSGKDLLPEDEAKYQEAALYTPGTYQGIGNGKGGEVSVEVTVNENAITSIKVLKHNDTPKKMDIAKNNVIKNILEEQTTKVDVVAQASFSSNAIMQATENALQKARKNAE